MTVSFLALLALLACSLRHPRLRLQPATVGRNVHDPDHRRTTASTLLAAVGNNDRETDSIVLDTLRTLGLARRTVERPVSGPKAYPRWWERVRAAVGLTILIVVLGVVVAVAVGVIILGFGFFLEQTTN